MIEAMWNIISSRKWFSVFSFLFCLFTISLLLSAQPARAGTGGNNTPSAYDTVTVNTDGFGGSAKSLGGDMVGCDWDSAASLTCSLASNYLTQQTCGPKHLPGLYNTQHCKTKSYWYDPEKSAEVGYDVFVAQDDVANYGYIVISTEKAYSEGCITNDYKQAVCLSADDGADNSAKAGGLKVGKINKGDNLNNDDDDKSICTVKMYKVAGEAPACKVGPNGRDVKAASQNDKTKGYKSKYSGYLNDVALKHSCEQSVGILSFILCPIIGYMNSTILAMIGTENFPNQSALNATYTAEANNITSEPKGLLISMLEVKPLLEQNDSANGVTTPFANSTPDANRAGCFMGDTGYACAIKTVWNNIKNITLGIFILIFLVIIFANTASIGIDNYTIKKILPRLIASAILIQFSLLIVSLLVDVFNILGATISDIILSLAPRDSICQQAGSDRGTNWAMVGGLASVFGLLIVSPAGPLIGVVGVILVLVLVLMVGIATITAFFALIARQLIIFGLVIASPIAFAAYILPGTEKYFKLWRDNLLKSLAMYPIATGLLSGALLFSLTVLGANACPNTDGTAKGSFNFQAITALLAPVVALLMLPKTFKWGGHLTSAIAGGIMGAGMRGNKAIANAGKNAAKRSASATKNAGQDRLAQSNFGKNTRIGRFMAGGGITSFARKNSRMGQAAQDRVEQRANAARQADAQRAGAMLSRANDLEAQAAALPAGSAKAAKLQAEAAAIRKKLYGDGATNASRAAAATAALNRGDQALLHDVTRNMDEASHNAWQRTLDPGQTDRYASMLHAYGQSLPEGDARRTAINDRLVGSSATPQMRAAGIKAMAAAGDGAGLVAAMGTLEHEQLKEAMSANPGTAKAAGVALANHYNSMAGSIDSSASDYNPAKADLHARITGFDANTGTVIADQPTDEFKAGVLSAAGKNTALTAGIRGSSSEATWKRLNADNPTALDAQKFQGEYHAVERVGKIAGASGDDIFGTNKDDQQVILSPENLGGVSADPNHGGGVISADQMYNTSHEVLAKTDKGKVRVPLARWAYSTDATDSSTAAYALGAHYAAVENARASGDTARQAHHEAEIARIQGLQTSVQTRLHDNGDLKPFDPTAPRPAPGGSTSPTTTPPGGGQIPGQGTLFNANGDIDDYGSGGTPPPSTPTPPGGGSGSGAPFVSPSGTPPGGGGGTPFNPMYFDPIDADLDPNSDNNRIAMTRILQDLADGATPQEAAANHLVGDVVESAPTENATVDDVATGATAGVVAGAVAGQPEAGWGAAADLARYEMERRAKEAARKTSEASEAQGARIDSLKKAQERQARGKTHLDAHGNEVSGSAQDPNQPPSE